MRAQRCIAFFVLISFALAGCAADQRDEELDADAFTAHFADQRVCGVYIDHLVHPMVEALAAETTVEGMRTVLQENASDRFAAVVARVQARAAKDGPLDPRREADQLKLTGYLFDELSRLPDFEQSHCSTDVREAVMETLYLGIGGQDARVIEQLLRAGAKGSWEQRWVLLTALMVGTLVPGSI